MKVQSKKSEKRINLINHRINTVSKLCALLFFSIFVLAFSDGYSNITKTKYVLFLVLSIGFIVYYTYEKGSLFLESPTINKTLLLEKLPYIFIGAYLFFCLLSCLISPYTSTLNSKGQYILLFGSERYDGFFTLFLCLLLFVVFSFEKVFSERLIAIIGISSLPAMLIGGLQLLGINVFGLYPDGNYFTNKKSFISTLGNIDIVSTYLVIVLGLMAFSYIAFQGKKIYSYLWLGVYSLGFLFLFEINVDSGKLAIILLLALALPVLSRNKDYFIRLLDICSLSLLCFGISALLSFRSSGVHTFFNTTFYVSLAAALIVFIIRLLFCKGLPNCDGNLWIYILALEILALASALVFLYRYSGKNETLLEFSAVLKGSFSDEFGNERLGVWKHTLRLIKERWLLGYGAGTYKIAMTEYLAANAPEFTEKIYDFAHNEYLQILYNCGVLGLSSYLGFIVTVIINGFKNMLKNPRALVLVFAVCGYLIQAFFTFSIVIVSPLFWLILGMLVAESKETESIN